MSVTLYVVCTVDFISVIFWTFAMFSNNKNKVFLKQVTILLWSFPFTTCGYLFRETRCTWQTPMKYIGIPWFQLWQTHMYGNKSFQSINCPSCVHSGSLLFIFDFFPFLWICGFFCTFCYSHMLFMSLFILTIICDLVIPYTPSTSAGFPALCLPN